MVYLIPTFLAENTQEVFPDYVMETVKKCSVIFAENIRTARRFLKSMDKEINIDQFEWYAIHKAEEQQISTFRERIRQGKDIAILSEAGCPGVADPGQILVEEAHKCNAIVKPLVGPSSLLLALMASGLNGQQFCFQGYLPIDRPGREKAIRKYEEQSAKNKSTQIFIETPYRNQAFFETLLNTCRENTRLCIAVNVTGADEMIKTQSIKSWKKTTVELHKKPAVFLLQA